MLNGVNDNTNGVNTLELELSDAEFNLINRMMKCGGVAEYRQLVAEALSLFMGALEAANAGKKIFEGTLSSKTREITEATELITPALQHAYKFRSKIKDAESNAPTPHPRLTLVSTTPSVDKDNDA